MTTSNSKAGVAAAALLLLSPAALHGETLRLKNGETLRGIVQHSYQGIYTVALPDGSLRTLGRHEIESIDFAPPAVSSAAPEAAPAPAPASPPAAPNFLSTLSKTDSPYGSPDQTFRTWRAAAIQGDIDRMAECYASFRQKEVRNQLKKLPKKAMEEMRAATAKTEFLPREPIYQGDRAFLEVAWTYELNGDNQTLQFLLEKDAWKIIQ